MKFRELLDTHKDLARKLSDLEKKYDHQFKAVFDAICGLIVDRETSRKKIKGLGQ